MAANLTDKNVAVVGASRGIGLEFTRQLLGRGCNVHATARKPDEAKGLQDLSTEKLTIAKLDTADPDSIRSWAKKLKGQQQFDYLFNIAGTMDSTRADVLSIDAERMLHCFTVNTIGPLLTVQQLLEQGLLGSGSTVANMTSKMGSITDNTSGRAYAYRASKAALNQVTKSLSIDLEAQGITCVLLHPGWVRTDMTGNNGLINVDECVSGLISVLETEKKLNGRMFDYKHDEIPW